MGRYLVGGTSSGSGVGLAFGEVKELIDGADVIDDLVKANGQLLSKASYPDLAAFTATNTSYAEYTVSNKTALFVRPVSEVENIIVYNSNFYCFYESAIDGTMATYWSMSPNGEDWTFPLLVSGSGTFNNCRQLGTSLFIMTSNGTFKYDGASWSLFNANITKDLAYNGTNIYIGCSATTTIYKSIDGIAWTTSTVADLTHSVVWCGTKFLKTSSIVTSAYHSVDGGTWTSTTLPYTPTTFKALYVNGNAIIPLSNTKLYCYSSDLLSWTNSGQGYSASASVSCFYDGTNYWFGWCNGSAIVTGKATVLSGAITSYTFIGGAHVSSAKVAYNGTIMLIAGVVPLNTNLVFWASSTLPTANITAGNNISTSFDMKDTGSIAFLGNGYLISDFVNSSFYSCLRVDDGTGLFKLKRYSTSQTYFQTNASTLVFGHYAKDSGYLYYTNTLGATATVTYHKVNSTNILETAGTLTNVRLDARPLCHSTGFFYTTSTANQSCSVVGNINYANTVAVQVNNGYVYISLDGKDIFLVMGGSPYDAYQSTNYGKSFNQFTPNIYNSAGALVTNTTIIASMYKLGGMYYSGGGVYGGYSPYLLNEIKGLTTGLSGVNLLQVNDNLIQVSTQQYIGTKSGTSTIRVGTSSASCGLAYTDPRNGDIYILNSTPTNVEKLIKPSVTDTTKFKVPNIPSNNNGKANYIKGVK